MLKNKNLEKILHNLGLIRAYILAEEAQSAERLDQVHANFRESARNLVHYLSLRRRDLRPLQLSLARLGLSSLGRAESHVLATVNAVLEILHRLTGSRHPPAANPAGVIDFATGERLLAEHTEALLGPATPGRGVRIMVTMPSEAADDYRLVRDLMQAGMNCCSVSTTLAFRDNYVGGRVDSSILLLLVCLLTHLECSFCGALGIG
jgi:pyruvate kinase